MKRRELIKPSREHKENEDSGPLRLEYNRKEKEQKIKGWAEDTEPKEERE